MRWPNGFLYGFTGKVHQLDAKVGGTHRMSITGAAWSMSAMTARVGATPTLLGCRMMTCLGFNRRDCMMCSPYFGESKVQGALG